MLKSNGIVHPITPEEEQAICTWQYPAPFDVYDATDPGVFLEPENRYDAVLGSGTLVGFSV